MGLMEHIIPRAHPKPLHHGKLTPKRSEPSRCVIASSWSKSCPRASLPGLHDSNGMKPYICFCTRGYPCLCANTHTHTRVPGWQEAPSGLENRHHLAHHALSCACLALCSLPSPSIIPHCDAPLRASPAMSMAAGARVRVRACVRACVAEASCARLLFPPAFSPTQISLIFGPTSDKTYTLILTRPTDPGLHNIR